MKRTSFLLVALLLVLTIGCKKKEEATNTAGTETSATTSSATDTSGTTPTGTSGTSNTAGTTSTTGSTSAAPLSDSEKKFAMKAAEGGLMEVNLGNLAASKATNPDVKAFGQRMQTDHGKAGDELMKVAKAKGFDLPTTPNAETQKASDELSKKSGAAFDKAYMKMMVEDHDKDVAEFKKEQSSVKDGDLKGWLDKTIPVIEDHKKSAHDINKKLK